MNVRPRNGFSTRGAPCVLPEISVVVQTLILHIAISFSLHDLVSRMAGMVGATMTLRAISSYFSLASGRVLSSCAA